MPPEQRSYQQLAEARFKRIAHQSEQAPIAVQEYRAQQQHALDRMKKLREQRLAREPKDGK